MQHQQPMQHHLYHPSDKYPSTSSCCPSTSASPHPHPHPSQPNPAHHYCQACNNHATSPVPINRQMTGSNPQLPPPRSSHHPLSTMSSLQPLPTPHYPMPHYNPSLPLSTITAQLKPPPRLTPHPDIPPPPSLYPSTIRQHSHPINHHSLPAGSSLHHTQDKYCSPQSHVRPLADLDTEQYCSTYAPSSTRYTVTSSVGEELPYNALASPLNERGQHSGFPKQSFFKPTTSSNHFETDRTTPLSLPRPPTLPSHLTDHPAPPLLPQTSTTTTLPDPTDPNFRSEPDSDILGSRPINTGLHGRRTSPNGPKSRSVTPPAQTSSLELKLHLLSLQSPSMQPKTQTHPHTQPQHQHDQASNPIDPTTTSSSIHKLHEPYARSLSLKPSSNAPETRKQTSLPSLPVVTAPPHPHHIPHTSSRPPSRVDYYDTSPLYTSCHPPQQSYPTSCPCCHPSQPTHTLTSQPLPSRQPSYNGSQCSHRQYLTLPNYSLQQQQQQPTHQPQPPHHQHHQHPPSHFSSFPSTTSLPNPPHFTSPLGHAAPPSHHPSKLQNHCTCCQPPSTHFNTNPTSSTSQPHPHPQPHSRQPIPSTASNKQLYPSHSLPAPIPFQSRPQQCSCSCTCGLPAPPQPHHQSPHHHTYHSSNQAPPPPCTNPTCHTCSTLVNPSLHPHHAPVHHHAYNPQPHHAIPNSHSSHSTHSHSTHSHSHSHSHSSQHSSQQHSSGPGLINQRTPLTIAPSAVPSTSTTLNLSTLPALPTSTSISKAPSKRSPRSTSSGRHCAHFSPNPNPTPTPSIERSRNDIAELYAEQQRLVEQQIESVNELLSVEQPIFKVPR